MRYFHFRNNPKPTCPSSEQTFIRFQRQLTRTKKQKYTECLFEACIYVICVMEKLHSRGGGDQTLGRHSRTRCSRHTNVFAFHSTQTGRPLTRRQMQSDRCSSVPSASACLPSTTARRYSESRRVDSRFFCCLFHFFTARGLDASGQRRRLGTECCNRHQPSIFSSRKAAGVTGN
jgi:hypothetical protein